MVFASCMLNLYRMFFMVYATLLVCKGRAQELAVSECLELIRSQADIAMSHMLTNEATIA